MNRPFPGFGLLIVIGLGWSFAVYTALGLSQLLHFMDHAYGGAAVLTGAILVLLAAAQQRHRWPIPVFAMVVLMIFGAAAADATTKILGAAAVAGWVRNSGPASLRCPVALFAEIASAIGTTVLAFGFHPNGPLAIGLCIWCFYLIQTIPMVVSGRSEKAAGMAELRSKFERTRHRVEKILASRI